MDPTTRSVDPAARQMLQVAGELKADTAWHRAEALQPVCGFGDLGLCCQTCYMGPCRIDPFGAGPKLGICGADADLMVARNVARAAATGAAAHSDHGREVVSVLSNLSADAGNGNGNGSYGVSDSGKLRRLAAEWGVMIEGRDDVAIAVDLGRAMAKEFGLQDGPLTAVRRAPNRLQEKWRSLGITPRGVDRDIVELLHRTHQGVESDPVALLRAAMRAALADGWAGSMMATDVSDVLFGGPEAIRSRANLGVLKADQVNILVHGHEPVLSEMVVRTARQEDLLAKARQAGAKCINVAGICCTANEILMRQGMPVAGNYLHQELALLTGAVDVMAVDVQCIMPSLPRLAQCHHTRVVTTSDKAHFPGATHVQFDPDEPQVAARQIIEMAIEGFGKRDPAQVKIPSHNMALVAGFTNENLPYYMGGRFRRTYRPLNDAIASGRIRGVVGLVGCNTTRFKQDAHHMHLVRRLLAADVLVAQTGCSAIASAKAGLMHPASAAEYAGPGLREVCEAVGIPPVLHLGSCVDNSRILNVCVSMVQEGGLGEDLCELPVAAAAPEAMSEKAMTIGLYAVASGVFTVFMPVPRVGGGSVVRRYLEEEVEKDTGGRFLFTDDVEAAAEALIGHLNDKRRALKLAPMLHTDGKTTGDPAAARSTLVYEQPKGLVALGCGKAQARSQERPPEQ